MSQTPTNPNLATGPAASDDPLAKLHKMSTTAGLGSGDYVAVNVPAVVTLLLGIASLLSRLSNTLLILPIAGVLCGIVAIRQISRSNGTQTGRAIAIIGLLLSLGIGGTVVASQAVSWNRSREDRAAISNLITTFGNHIKTEDYDRAYQLFGEKFRSRVTVAQFKERFVFFATPQAKELYGDFQSLKWNGYAQFDIETRTGETFAGSAGLMHFGKVKEPFRQPMLFRKSSTGWVIEEMPDLFPAPNPQQGQEPSPGIGPEGPAAP